MISVFVLFILSKKAANPAGCNGTLQECRRLVTVINNAYNFSDRVYARQMQSVVCYATRHGYGYDQIDPASFERCSEFKDVFFFAKHCAVAEYLKGLKRGALAYVLDGDVAEANPAVKLHMFDSPGMDIIFYERLWNSEIVSGNYIARNTLFTRIFLRKWALYFYKQPKGFSSADNGALHAALAEFKRANGPIKGSCETGYQQLTDDVYNLKPYFNWVKMCRDELKPETFIQGLISDVIGNIIIAKKGRGFVADGAYLNWKTGKTTGYPPLYHGIKNKEVLKKFNGCWKLVVN